MCSYPVRTGRGVRLKSVTRGMGGLRYWYLEIQGLTVITVELQGCVVIKTGVLQVTWPS